MYAIRSYYAEADVRAERRLPEEAGQHAGEHQRGYRPQSAAASGGTGVGLETLLELFSPQPGYKILDITAHTDVLSAALLHRLSGVNGRLSLAQYPGEHAALAEEEGATLQLQRVPDYTKLV